MPEDERDEARDDSKARDRQHIENTIDVSNLPGADGRGEATEAKTDSVVNELAPTLSHLPAPDTDEKEMDQTVAQKASDTSPAVVRSGDGRYAKRFGDYAIEAEIARGGMGVVFKAKQLSLNRTVALKMILSAHLAGPDDVRRFHAEAESAAKLDHTGIVPIYEVGEVNDQHFFSMALVEGGSLFDLVVDGPLDDKPAARLVRLIAQAVQYAHTRNIVHRDLKPANVLLDSNGQPKITDFGLAKNIEEDSGLTATGAVMGTPGYMAPEQAAGKVDEVGPLADVYAVGGILYFLLTGQPPFRGSTAIETIQQVLSTEPTSPRQHNDKVDLDLATICLKCLEKDPSRRYASAGELAEELELFLDGRPITARPVGATEKTWRWCKRNPVVASLGALIGLVLLTAPFVAAQQMKLRSDAVTLVGEKEVLLEAEKTLNQKLDTSLIQTEQARDLAELTSYASDMQLAYEYLEKGRFDEAGVLLRKYDEASKKKYHGWEYFYLGERYRTHANILFGNLEDVLATAWSPSGALVATAGKKSTYLMNDEYKDRPHEILAWDVLQRRVARRLTISLDDMAGHEEQVTTLAWSPDGGQLAAGANDGSLVVWNILTGDTELELDLDKPIHGATWAPEGGRIVVGCSGGGVRIIHLNQDLKPTWLGSEDADSFHVSWSADGRLIASGEARGRVSIWNASNGKLLVSLREGNKNVTQAVFSPDSRRLATFGWDGVVHVWDPRNATQISQCAQVIQGDSSRYDKFNPWTLSWSSDSRSLVSAGWDTMLRIIDPNTGMVREEIPTSSHVPNLVSWSPNRKWFLSAVKAGGYAVIAELKDGKTEIGVKPFDSVSHPKSSSPVISRNGALQRLSIADEGIASTVEATAGGGRIILLRSEKKGNEQLATGWCSAATWSPDGSEIAIGGYGGKVQLWDAQSGLLTKELFGHSNWVTGLAYNPTGNRLASIQTQQELLIWSTITGAVERRVPLKFFGQQAVHEVSWSPDGELTVIVAGDGLATVIEAATGRMVAMLEPQERRPQIQSSIWDHDVEWQPNGSLLAVLAQNSVEIWDRRDYRRVKRFESRALPIAWSTDGKRLAFAPTEEYTIAIVDTKTWERVSSCPLPPAVTDLKWSPDNRRLVVVGGAIGTIFEPKTGQPLLQMRLTDDQTNVVVWSPDGRSLLTGGQENVTKIWRAPMMPTDEEEMPVIENHDLPANLAEIPLVSRLPDDLTMPTSLASRVFLPGKELTSVTGEITSAGIQFTSGSDKASVTAGPATMAIPRSGVAGAAFRLRRGEKGKRNYQPIWTLEIYDHDAQRVVTSRSLREIHFKAVGQFQDFVLWFDAVAGHRYDFRARWHGQYDAALQQVALHVQDDPITRWNVDFYSEAALDNQRRHLRPDAKPIHSTETQFLDFRWGESAPAEGVPADGFIAVAQADRWLGSGIYHIGVVAEQGVRVVVDDKTVIDTWDSSGRTDQTVEIELTEDKHAFRVETIDRSGSARLEFGLVNVAASEKFKSEYVNVEPLQGYLVLQKHIRVPLNTVAGTWQQDETGLLSPAEGFGALNLPYWLPKDFVLQMDVERLSGNGALNLQWNDGWAERARPIQTLQLDAIEGEASRHSSTSFSERIAKQTTSNPQASALFDIGKPVAVELRCTDGIYAVHAGGRKLFESQPSVELSDDLSWKLLGFSTQKTQFRISNMRLKLAGSTGSESGVLYHRTILPETIVQGIETVGRLGGRPLVVNESDDEDEGWYLKTILLEGCRAMDDAAAKEIFELAAHVVHLDLSGTAVTDASVSHLLELTDLQTLDITGTKIGKDSAERLRIALPDCRVLQVDLENERAAAERLVTEGAVLTLTVGRIEHQVSLVAELPEAEFLVDAVTLPSGIAPTEKFCRALSQLGRLRRLRLKGAEIDEAHLELLCSFPELELLDVSESKQGARILERLRHPKNLRALGLAGVSLSDLSLDKLSDLTGLVELDLSFAKATPDELGQLISITRPHRLKLSGTRVNDETLLPLLDNLQLYELSINETDVTDAVLVKLSEQESLTHLELAGSRVTAEGIGRFREAKKDCQLDPLSAFERQLTRHANAARWEDALRWQQVVLRESTPKVVDWMATGTLYLQAGDMDGYLRACQSAKELTSTGSIANSDVMEMRCWSSDSGEDSQTRYQQAIAALKTNPGSTRLKVAAGLAAYRAGDYEEALMHLDISGDQLREPLSVFFEAMSLKQLGRDDEALGKIDEGRADFHRLFPTIDGPALARYLPPRWVVYSILDTVQREAEQVLTPIIERRVAEWVLENKGFVVVRTSDGKSVKVDNIDSLPEVDFSNVYLSISGVADLIDQDLDRILDLQHLEHVDLNGNRRLTVACFDVLLKLPKLRRLSLYGVPLSDADVSRLVSERPDLVFLNLGGTKITDAVVGELAKLKNLWWLQLGSPNLTDRALSELAEFPKLRVVRLGNNRGISDSGVESLTASTKIQSLELHHSPITDAALISIAKLTELKTLNVSHTRISDAELSRLGNLKKLVRLDLRRTKVTAEGVEQLHSAIPQSEIVWDGGTISQKPSEGEVQQEKTNNGK